MQKPIEENSSSHLASYQLLTEREVAKMLNISVSTLQKNRLMSRGLRFVALGRSRRYVLADVLQHIQDSLCKSTSEVTAKITKNPPKK